MGARYSIGQLARAAEVPTSTVRYYERVGLLPPAGRTASNYRYYDEEALEQLRFIRAAQATGFVLDDVTALLEVRCGAREPCHEVQGLIEERLRGVEQRLKDLARVKKVLKASLNKCRTAQDAEHCRVLDDLTLISSTNK